MKKTLATLQAEKLTLEQDIKVLTARTDDASKQSLAAKKAQLETVEAQTELAEIKAREATQLATDADLAIQAMEANGQIFVQGDAAVQRRAELKASFTDPVHGKANREALAGESLRKTAVALQAGHSQALGTPGAPRPASVAGALTCGGAKINAFALDCESAYGYEFNASSGWNAREALAGYAELVCANGRLRWNGHDTDLVRSKSRLSLAAGNWYKEHLQGKEKRWETIPARDIMRMVSNKALSAADYTDPNNELGTLSGTLVLQRTLPVFSWMFPEFGAMTTDFSDAPGLFKQTETTRIVTQPTVQVYNTTLVAPNSYVTSGVPQGFITAVEGTDTDVSLTLSDYIGVPIAIGNNILASTTRRLFDEQAVLAIKAVAQYLASMVTNLFTNIGAAPNSANSYNYYQTANGTTIPIAYPTYSVSSQTFSMKDLDNLDAAFTSAKVPEDGRFILLNPKFYAQLRGDTRLEFLYAASAKDLSDTGAGQFLTEARLPKLSGFAPYKAGYMPNAAPQPTVTLPNQTPTLNNIVGFAGHKAGIIMKARVPQDIRMAVDAQAPGTITTVTDPDTGISIMLVQFINLQANYAMWRPEVMLGTTVGDNRGGLILTGS